MKVLRYVALILCLVALLTPWFTGAGKSLNVMDLPPMFMAPYFTGMCILVVGIVKRERFADLASSALLASSPAYAYMAAKLVVGSVTPTVGAMLSLMAALLLAVAWLRGAG